jgi:hypothetical protein
MRHQTIKSTFLSAALFFSVFLVTHAQSPFQAGFSFGAITTQVDGDGFGGYDKSGAHAGMWVSRRFADNFSYMLEIAYKPKGSKSAMKATTEDLNYYKLSLHYVEVPVTLRYHNKNYLFDISVGAAYLAMERVEGLAGGFLTGNELTGFNKFDVIVAAGLGIEINDYWNVLARITYSAYDAAKTYRAPEKPHLSWQFNNALSVALYRKIGR